MNDHLPVAPDTLLLYPIPPRSPSADVRLTTRHALRDISFYSSINYYIQSLTSTAALTRRLLHFYHPSTDGSPVYHASSRDRQNFLPKLFILYARMELLEILIVNLNASMKWKMNQVQEQVTVIVQRFYGTEMPRDQMAIFVPSIATIFATAQESL